MVDEKEVKRKKLYYKLSAGFAVAFGAFIIYDFIAKEWSGFLFSISMFLGCIGEMIVLTDNEIKYRVIISRTLFTVAIIIVVISIIFV